MEKKVTKPKVTKPKVTKIQYGGIEYLNQNFVDEMYNNMWQYMNIDTIQAILNNAGCNNISVNSIIVNKFYNRRKKLPDNCNQIIHEYINEEVGHYIYVDKNCTQHGTYENNLLHKDDDGICHGAAIYYALTECNSDKYNFFGQIYENSNNSQEIKQNYITILKVYLYIIDHLKWEEILKTYFYKKYKSIQIVNSRNLLNQLIVYLEFVNNNNNNIMNNNNNIMNNNI